MESTGGNKKLAHTKQPKYTTSKRGPINPSAHDRQDETEKLENEKKKKKGRMRGKKGI